MLKQRRIQLESFTCQYVHRDLIADCSRRPSDALCRSLFVCLFAYPLPRQFPVSNLLFGHHCAAVVAATIVVVVVVVAVAVVVNVIIVFVNVTVVV